MHPVILHWCDFFTKYKCEYDGPDEYSLFKVYKTKNIMDEKTNNVIKLIDILSIFINTLR